MKPAFESLSSFKHQSFLVRRFGKECFAAPYHFHPEYELTFILSGSGKRYIGTNMGDFYPGDFVLAGSNLPHCWKIEQSIQQENSGSIVVQFRKEFLGDDFFDKPEMTTVLQILQKSNNGLHFTGNTEGYEKKMLQLHEEKNSFKKIILFLDLLHELSLTKSCELLQQQQSQTTFSPAEQQRIHIALAYIVEHFKNEVSLNGAGGGSKYDTTIVLQVFQEAYPQNIYGSGDRLPDRLCSPATHPYQPFCFTNRL